MWINKNIVGWFGVNVETVRVLQSDLAVARAERDTLKSQIVKAEILADWFRMQVNQLQLERTALMEKAYNIRIPTPEISRLAPPQDPSTDPKNFSFEDVGDEMAKKLGLPVWGN